jgi:hypothetical protein
LASTGFSRVLRATTLIVGDLVDSAVNPGVTLGTIIEIQQTSMDYTAYLAYQQGGFGYWPLTSIIKHEVVLPTGLPAACTASARYLSEVYGDAPWAHWRLADTTGSAAVDCSGAGRDATYTNPLLAQSARGADAAPSVAAAFVANYRYVRLPSVPSINSGGAPQGFEVLAEFRGWSGNAGLGVAAAERVVALWRRAVTHYCSHCA